MSLPLPWVDRIFEKLTLVYGQAFLARWRDLDLDAVKHDWAHELDGFERHPKAIAHALQALPPEKPPTVLQFRELARRAPLPELPRLESPPADAERVAAELGDLMFLLVDFARWQGIDAEDALRTTNNRFERRFRHMEQGLKAQGKDFKTSSREERRALWEEAKRLEKGA